MTVKWRPIHIHEVDHEVLDVVKEATGYSKAELIHRFCTVLSCNSDVIERGFMISIIPYVRKPIKEG